MTVIHSSDDRFYIAPQKVYMGVSLAATAKTHQVCTFLPPSLFYSSQVTNLLL